MRIVWILEGGIVMSLVLPVVVLVLSHMMKLRLQICIVHQWFLLDEMVLLTVLRHLNCMMLHIIAVVLLMLNHWFVIYNLVGRFVRMRNRHIIVNVMMDLFVDNRMWIMMNNRVKIVLDNWMNVVGLMVLMLVFMLTFMHFSFLLNPFYLLVNSLTFKLVLLFHF